VIGNSVSHQIRQSATNHHWLHGWKAFLGLED